MNRPRLTALSPADNLQPIAIGEMVLSEIMGAVFSLAPFQGQHSALSKALGAMPEAGAVLDVESGTLLWSARGQMFHLGPLPAGLETMAAITDQSDAWARFTLEGPALEAVLARLCPLDLSAFQTGQSARSLLGHMNALYWRQSEQEMEIWVFRSMAHSAIDELSHAMKRVTARG